MINLQTRKIGKYTVIDVNGRLEHLKDSLALKSLINTMAEGSPVRLALNLGEIDYIDSGGINVIVYGHKKMQQGGGSFCLVSPSPYLLEMIQVTGLEQMFTIYPSENNLPN